MTIVRLNTFYFDFRNAPTPLEIDIHKWFRSQGVKDGEAEVINNGNYRKRVALKLRQSETFIKLLDRFSERGVTYCKDAILYEIPYFAINLRKSLPRPISPSLSLFFLSMVKFYLISGTKRIICSMSISKAPTDKLW